MFLLYVDASGTPISADIASKHYVLAGIAVHEGTWFALEKRIAGLKRRYAFAGEDFELHAMDFNIPINEQSEIPSFENMNHHDRRSLINEKRKKKIELLVAAQNNKKIKELKREFRRTAPFVHLTRQERSNLYRDSLEIIGNHEGLTLFAEAIDKQHPLILNQSVDPTNQAFEQVITRFDAFLERKRLLNQLSRSRASKGSTGLIVMDQDQATEKNIQSQFDNIRTTGHHWGHLRHVVDTPFFVSSARCSGVQIVDICAYAIRRYLDTGCVSGSHEENNFKRIYSLFDRNGGRLHGFRHFIRRGDCNCLGCDERGDSAHQAVQPA